MEKLSVNLAGKDYEIGELTVGQLEAIQEVLLVPAPNGGVFKKGADREVIAIALSVDHPDMTSAAVAGMRLGSIKKLDEISRKILQFAGFTLVNEKEPEAPGEDPARVTP